MSSVVDECDSHTFVSMIASVGERGRDYLERLDDDGLRIATVECSENASDADWLAAMQRTLRAIG